MSIVGIGFSATDSSDKNSLSHSASLPAYFRVTSSVFIVDLVIKVYFEDLHKTATPSSVNIYSFVAFVSLESEIQFASLHPSSIVGYPI